MKLSLKIAIRFIKKSKVQSILITLGIAVGVAVQVFLGTLINNLGKDLIDKTLGGTSQVTIRSDNNNNPYFNETDVDIDMLKKLGVFSEISKSLDVNGLVKNGEGNEAVLLKGVDSLSAADIYGIKDKLVTGNVDVNNNEIIVGKTLLEKLKKSVGDDLILVMSNKKELTLKISGVVDYGVGELNKSWIVGSLSYIQEEVNRQGEISSIETKLDDNKIFDADVISDDLSKEIPKGLIINNWKSDNASLLSAISGQKSSSTTIQVFIIISVVIGIAGVLAISVMQKSKEIGILKAMGIRDKSAALIFLNQGFILGILGATIGLFLGLGLFKIFTAFVKNSDGTPIVSGGFNLTLIVFSFCIFVVASLIAATLAATRSLKLNPIEVIRNN
ncbi:ABC transporter permease [Clostridium paridis]|uniref:ABC transporter permease n=1 Tax=Clostridium paridis TaxID=2803863 RepID=A0A937FJG0_9CLOT|nr:FtsX-like permease family protein [Clostridium paridis]MBL4933587.1 ABC transporter permease [Clostridium paridis]